MLAVLILLGLGEIASTEQTLRQKNHASSKMCIVTPFHTAEQVERCYGEAQILSETMFNFKITYLPGLIVIQAMAIEHR